MSGTEFERPPAKSIETLDLHLMYLQRQVAKLVDAMPQMATKSDIDALARRLDGYATQDEVRTLRLDLEQIRQQMDTESVGNQIDRWGNRAQRVAAIIAFLAGGAYFLHGLLEAIKP